MRWQVMEYAFPGMPCPPLDVMFMMCRSMKSWLDTDPSNVVVLHCQGTKVRDCAKRCRAGAR